MILLDIDKFKSVNDIYGHDAGDLVLKSVATLLQDLVRKSDVVCRWGGEEFLILLQQCDAEEASHIGEKIRHKIQTDSEK